MSCAQASKVQYHFAGQQSGHADARAEVTVERAALGFIQQAAARRARGEQQEHDADAGRVERDGRAALLFTHHVADFEGHRPVVIGVAHLGAIAEPRQSRFDVLPLLRCQAAAFEGGAARGVQWGVEAPPKGREERPAIL